MIQTSVLITHAVFFHRDTQSPDVFSTGVEPFIWNTIEISALLSQIFCVNLFSVKG